MELLTERFADKWTREKGCWLWVARKNAGGYGTFKADSKSLLAHRVSYELYVGEIPDGMCVCHKCDTPACVNPQHLFLGSHKDNAVDCVQKGRRADQKGRHNNNYNMTVHTFKHEDGAVFVGTASELIAQFGLYQSGVSRMVTRVRDVCKGWRLA